MHAEEIACIQKTRKWKIVCKNKKIMQKDCAHAEEEKAAVLNACRRRGNRKIEREKGSGEHYALRTRGDRKMPCCEGKRKQEDIML
jgi:hypothetical protein